MSRPAESMTIDGVTHSWYCTVCGTELGVDLDEWDGMPPSGCSVHGVRHVAWETWNVVTDPAYPHRIIRAQPRVDQDPPEWCYDCGCPWDECWCW